MKKIFSLGLMLVALTLMNCSKEEIATEAPAVNGAAFELFAATEDGRTVNSGWNTQWAEGDQITVIHAENGTQDWVQDTPEGAPFTIADLATGRFTGTLQAELDAESYDWYLFYPYNKYIAQPIDLTAGYTYIGSRSDRSQAQTGVDNMTHIAGSNYPLYGKVTNVAVGEIPSVTMHNVSSLVEFAVKNTESEAIAISEIQFTSTEDIVGSYYIDFGGETLGFKDSGASYVSSTAKLSITDATIEAGATAKFYMAVKPHAVTAGDLTIKVTADAGACTKTLEGVTTTFTAGKVKTINFTYVAPAPTPTETWTRITSVDDLVDGKYVVLVKDQAGTIGYLPTEVKNSPTFGTQAIFSSIETETYSVSVPEEMVWNFARNSDGNWVLTTNSGDYFFGTDSSTGLNVGTTADAWTITAHSKNAEAFAFRNDDVARNAGVYHKDGAGVNWRSYNGDTYTNYGTNGVGAQIILYYCGTLAEKTQLATPTVTATVQNQNEIVVSWSEVANAGSYEVTCGKEKPQTITDALTCTFTNLYHDTEYAISVVALPANGNVYKKSEAGTATARTEASTNPKKILTFTFTTEPQDGWETAVAGTYNYILDGVSYPFVMSKQNSGIIWHSSKYLMIYSKNASESILLPQIDGFKLTMVVITPTSNCSTGAQAGITDSATIANYIEGGANKVWSDRPAAQTYTLSATDSSTNYYLYFAQNKNAQIAILELTYEK